MTFREIMSKQRGFSEGMEIIKNVLVSSALVILNLLDLKAIIVQHDIQRITKIRYFFR